MLNVVKFQKSNKEKQIKTPSFLYIKEIYFNFESKNPLILLRRLAYLVWPEPLALLPPADGLPNTLAPPPSRPDKPAESQPQAKSPPILNFLLFYP